MKILLVSDAHRVGGAEHYLSLLVSGLIKEKHDVEIICPDRKKWINFAQDLKQKGAKVHSLSLKSRHDLGRFYFLPFLNISQILLLTKFYKKISPDILHINSAGVEDAQTCIIASKLAGIKTTIITNHTGLFLPYKIKSFNIKLIDILRKTVIKKIDKHASKRIAVSKATSVLIQKEYHLDQHKFEVIYNGVEFKKNEINFDFSRLREKLELAETDIVLICIANLFKEKGIDYLLKALPAILENNKDVKLLIAGDGPLRDNLKNSSNELNISGSVKFLGKIDNVEELLAISKIFVLPSLGEGLPFVILEAMAAGLPCVATNVGGIPEMITNSKEGYIVEPCDSKSLASAINKILANNETAKKMSNNARARIEEKFNLNIMIKKTLSLYNKVLKD